MRAALLLVLLALTGCANTSVLRVVEYHGGGLMALRGDGIAVHQSGEFTARVDIQYNGDRASIKVSSHAVSDAP